MPQFKNNTAELQKFKVKGRTLFTMEAGEERYSKYYTTNEDITILSHEPYSNRVVAVEELTSLSAVTPQYVDIDDDTDHVVIINITDSITVYRQSTSNTPAEMLNWTAMSPVIPIPADATFTKLGFLGSGNCAVYQYT